MDNAKASEYLTLFNRHNVSAVFAGHLHENELSEYNGIKMIATSAVGIATPFSQSREGVRVIRQDEKVFRHAFIAFENID